MWHLGVVLLDVERNEGSEALDGVQRVEVQPLVLERTPQRLNHRVEKVTSTWASTRSRQALNKVASTTQLMFSIPESA